MRGLVLSSLLLGSVLLAQEPYGDISDLKILKAEDRVDAPSTPPPPGATVLFDGKNVDAWSHTKDNAPVKWKLVDLDRGGKALEVLPKLAPTIYCHWSAVAAHSHR